MSMSPPLWLLPVFFSGEWELPSSSFFPVSSSNDGPCVFTGLSLRPSGTPAMADARQGDTKWADPTRLPL